MNNNGVFDKNINSYLANNLNTSKANIESKKLQNKIDNNNQNRNLVFKNANNISNKNNNTISRINNVQKNKTQNSRPINMDASKVSEIINNSNETLDKLENGRGQKNITNIKKKNPTVNFLNNIMGFRQKEMEEENSDGLEVNFKIPIKVIKWMIIISPAVLVFIIFICLFISASQIYLNAITFGNAESLPYDDNAEEKIEKLMDSNKMEDLDEIKDEDLESDWLSYSDITLSKNNIANIKLLNTNLVSISGSKFNEADLSELNDYYSGFSNFSDGKYDMNVVYNFFFKLMYIQRYYESKYNVVLDMPLLISVLRLQSSDYGEVFSSNIKNYDVKAKQDNEWFDYNYDWSGYIPTKTYSEHDIELLAQRMVVRVSGVCSKTIDGLCYELADATTYKEFLKEFIEKKYYVEGVAISKRTDNVITNDDTSSKYVSAMLELAEKELNLSNVDYVSKYNSYFNNSVNSLWDVSFVSYLASETKVSGISLASKYNISTSTLVEDVIKSFSTSSKLDFYYNDFCTNLNGKNDLSLNYVPKAGDYIFFDWDNDTDGTFENGLSSNVDHVGIVISYKDNIITTIEGGLAGSQGLKKVKRNITSCEVVGFGSWYKEEVISNQNTTNSSPNTSTPFIKYSLTEDQLLQIASLCVKEQGSAKGAAAEASLMANLFEIKGSSYGTGAAGLYNYVRNSGWFANASKNMDAKIASDDVVAAVKSVLVDGKRILPGYIDEHDCFNCNSSNRCSDGSKGDICTVTNNGKNISKTDRNSYVKYTTRISTVYGANYTFYSFPTSTSDPFGYTSEKLRKQIGECYFDYDTGKPINCG